MSRVPVILQMTPNECGAACLAMVLTFYGRETTVSECREALQSGRDGVTAREIAQAARDLGLRVKAYSVDPDGLAQIQTPAIIHWHFTHFMVLERWTPQRVDVVDPAVGRRRLTAEEFDADFTGVVLTLEPGANFRRRRSSDKLTLRTFTADLMKTPGTAPPFAQILVASALLLLLGLVFPLFTMILVDNILPAQNYNMLTILGIGMVVLVVAQVILGYLRSALALYLEARLDMQVMLGFFEHMLMLPFRFFQERTSGDLLMRLGSISVIRDVLTSQMVSAILDGVMVFFYLLILLIWWPLFGLITLLFGAAQVLLLWRTTGRLYELTERDLAAQAESQSYLVEALTGVATLKASAAEDRALEHWSDLFFKQLNISLKRNHMMTLIDTGRDAIDSLAPVLLLWIGALWVLNGQMSLGAMLAVTTLAISFLGPLASLVANGQQLHLIGAHMERIADVLSSTPEQDVANVETAPDLSGRIELSDASFRYHANAPWAVREASIFVEPGQKIALVGPTGSGKSTLAMLLLGLYTLDQGEIRYDGKLLSSLNYRTVRRQFGAVLQEPTLFSGTIRSNISLHDPSLTLEQIESAAQLAKIHDEIAALPMGYETIIAEGGIDMAGGQRQRIALARALVHKPAILLLDEATSHLDAVTERLVDSNLSNLDCTRIVIAHRLSTVRNADMILVLDKGVIVERGTHEALLALGRAYASLVRDQNTTHGSDVLT